MSQPRHEEASNAFGELVDTFAAPIKSEVAARAAHDPLDMRFHRVLSDVLDDCRDLTAFAARRNTTAMKGQIEAWLERQREADKERAEGMVSLIESLGGALKRTKGDEANFFGAMDKDLQQLQRASDRSSVANASARLKSVVAQMTLRFEQQKERSDRRIEELAGIVQTLNDELRQVRHQATEDPLTGLHNRGSFDTMLDDFLRRARLAPFRFCLIMFDLDHFKAVNDTHGHVVGDQVLKMAGAAVSRVVLRSSDFAARYGGEEFAVLLADSGPERAQKVAEEIRLELRQGRVEGADLVQTASFGVAEGSERDQPAHLISRADACLYKAKKAGRDQVVVAGFGPLGRRVRVPRGVEIETQARPPTPIAAGVRSAP